MKNMNKIPLSKSKHSVLKKKEPLSWIEIQNTENQNTTDNSTSKQMLTQENKINAELIKKIMTEKKIGLSSLKNQDWKKVKSRNWKGKHIITKYLNKQHHRTKWTNLCRNETSLW